MTALQDQYDEAMFEFSMGEFAACIEKLEAILVEDPNHFDARLSLGMAYCRQGDFARAIEEGHKAEKLQPNDQLVHTNLSLFYVRAGDKEAAERHGLQSRIASWKGNMEPPTEKEPSSNGLGLAQESPSEVRISGRKPDSNAPEDPRP